MSSKIREAKRFKLKRKRLTAETYKKLVKLESLWKKVSAKRDAFYRLCHHFHMALQSFTRYKIIRGYTCGHCVLRSIDLIDKLEEIDRQEASVCRMIAIFQEKLLLPGKIFDDIAKARGAFATALGNKVDKLMTAKSVEDLAHLPLINENWIKGFSDPKVEQLADEWKAMDVNNWINYLNQQLQLVHYSIRSFH